MMSMALNFSINLWPWPLIWLSNTLNWVKTSRYMYCFTLFSHLNDKSDLKKILHGLNSIKTSCWADHPNRKYSVLKLILWNAILLQIWMNYSKFVRYIIQTFIFLFQSLYAVKQLWMMECNQCQPRS